ncbi:hypothetical protein AB5J72_22225 [Streptomyces sp. CG1]|uniref:hypothetical protein n=1 Tax=Streptomyces sp. CG1 TaxID=1287523 RepID=UPI0034E1A48A
MSTGKIQEWNPGPGSGKIKNDEGGAQLEFDSNDLRTPAERGALRRGDKVEFQVDTEDRNHAVDVGKPMF